MYKALKDVNSTVLIICYQSKEDKEEVSEKNEVEVGVIAKDALMNYSNAIPNYL